MLLATRYSVNSQKGYTLVELMVAIGIFSIIVGVMSTSFVTSLRGQKKSITAQNTADNIRFAMEMMSKEIRMGRGFAADNNGGACGAVNCRLQFTSTMPHRYNKSAVFYLNGNQIMFDDDMAQPPAADSITSSQNISVNSLEFAVSGGLGGNPPRVTIITRAKSASTADAVSTAYDIQTTISPKSL